MKSRLRVAALFQTRSRDECVREAARRDICLTPVLALDELEKDPPLQQRDMFITLPHPRCGNIKSIGVPIKFKGTPAIVRNPPPILGQGYRCHPAGAGLFAGQNRKTAS